MESLIVADLKRFDSEKLSFYKIVYSKFKCTWILFGIVTSLVGLSFMGYVFIPFNFQKWWALLISLPFLIVSFCFVRNKIHFVLNEHYNYNLKITDQWDAIQFIRLKLFKDELNRIGIAKTDTLTIIIKYLEYDSNSNKYNYTFSTTIFSLIFGALLGVFVSGFLDKTQNIREYYQVCKIFLGIALMIVITIVYFDWFILKEIILLYRNRNKRLVQTISLFMIEELKTKDK